MDSRKVNLPLRLLIYQHSILNALENSMQVDSIRTDFSKAFDRIQSFKIRSIVSRPIYVTSDVHQGSRCGPYFSLVCK